MDNEFETLLQPLTKVPEWHSHVVDQIPYVVDGETRYVSGKHLMIVFQQMALALWVHHSGRDTIVSFNKTFDNDRHLLEEAGKILSGGEHGRQK